MGSQGCEPFLYPIGKGGHRYDAPPVRMSCLNLLRCSVTAFLQKIIAPVIVEIVVRQPGEYVEEVVQESDALVDGETVL